MIIKEIVAFIILFFLFQFSGFSQFTLPEALSKARTHTPLAKVQQLANQEKDLKLENIQKQYFPQLTISAQASYQSDVTTFPLELPGVQIDPLSKDQYRILGEVNQKLYDAGATHQQKKLAITANAIENNGVEVEMENIRAQIIYLYFGILELDARLRVTALSKEDLLASLKLVDAAFTNGTALKSEKHTLEAGIINLDQQIIELQATRTTLIQSIHLLTNASINAASEFVVPNDLPETESINPDKYAYRMFDLQQELLNQQYEVSLITSKPMVHFFLQGGYGKPSLNFLENEFAPFYVVGLRANWKLNNLYTKSNDREILTLGREKIKAKKEAIAMQTDINFSKYQVKIIKINDLVDNDRALLSLRQQITETAKVQLENGVMTSADFLARFNEEKIVEENLILREIQLLKAQYFRAHIAGDYR